MTLLRDILLLAAPFLFAGCGENEPESEALDGVYHRTGGFEAETLVLRDDRFEWWFSRDTPLPDVFPLRGEFLKRGDKIELTYEDPKLRIESFSSPPHFLELVEHPSPLIRSHRFIWDQEWTDETQEVFEAAHQKEDQLLFRTILKPGDDLDALGPSPSFDFPGMLVADQRDRYRKAFGFVEGPRKIGTEQD